MKKLFFIFGVLISIGGVAGATGIDTQLIDQLSGNIQDANQLKFTQAKSCETLEAMLAKYAKERPDPIRYYEKGVFGIDTVNMMAGTNAIAPTATNSVESMDSSSTDFSQTNIQKSGVDELEKLKTDGKYFYYYNEKSKKISIIASPLDIKTSTLDAKNIKILKEIAVPDQLQDIELFIAPNRLILIGNLYSTMSYGKNRWIEQDQRSVVAIYDISNLQALKLLKFENIPGYYQDARLIDNTLYTISQLNFNRRNRKNENPTLHDSLARVAVTDQGAELQSPDCSEISYVLPEDKDLNLDPVFTIISATNIQKTTEKTETTALLAPSGEIHMSKNALYLVSNFYTTNNRPCPNNMFCVMPIFRSTTQTLIHKFSRNGSELTYQNTAIVPGSLLTQYSMDEDSNGYFRILTKVWDAQQATNLYLFNPDLSLAGKLENIEPGEEFKSSRYIEDKLYLVTFEQIDPLFVIDLEKPKTPKILGELKIPGYSTYLHPLKKEGTKQYLLGIGYATKTNQRGGVTNAGVKLSLFEIDYAKKEGEQISIKELSNLTQGGEGSDSEALRNPRLFVMDKEGNVTLPLQLTERKKEGEDCKIKYDSQGKEQSKECTPILEPSDFFVGLKQFSITPEKGIQERFAKNYFKDFLKKNNIAWTGSSTVLENSIDTLNQQELLFLSQMRVGYAGDALYTFNPLFADFIFPNKTNYMLWFDN